MSSEKFNKKSYKSILDSISSENITPKNRVLINGTYSENYNICFIDDIIKNKLKEEEKYFLPTIKNRILFLEEELNKKHDYITYNKIISDINNHLKTIKDVKSGKRYDDYINLTSDIIYEYSNIKSDIKYLDFSEIIEYKESDIKVNHKIYLIENYLQIAKKYIDIDVSRIRPERIDNCVNCSSSLKDIIPDENGIVICEVKNCQTEHITISNFKTKKEVYKSGNSNGDDSIDNFIKAFLAYQGIVKMTKEAIKKLCDELDAYFISINKPIGEEIKKLPLNSRGRRGETTHKTLNMALSKIGKTEHYKHTNFIGHIYWGWKLPNVSHLEEIIKRDYIKTQKAYNQIPEDVRERSSSLGTNYRLYRHLQLRGHKCYMDEFKIAENDKSIRIHDNTWRLTCELTEDPEIYYMESNENES